MRAASNSFVTADRTIRFEVTWIILGDHNVNQFLQNFVFLRKPWLTSLIFLYFAKSIYFLQETRLSHSTNKMYSGSASGVLFQMKTRVFLKYFVCSCLCTQFFASNSLQAPSNLICLTILLTLRSLTQF